VRFVPSLLELDRRDVVEVLVEPGGVVPVDPRKRGELHILDGAPRTLAGAADEFALV